MYKEEKDFHTDEPGWLGYASVSRIIEGRELQCMCPSFSRVNLHACCPPLPTHAHTQGKLYYFPLGKGEDTITVINPDTLQTEGTLELDGEPSPELCTSS